MRFSVNRISHSAGRRGGRRGPAGQEGVTGGGIGVPRLSLIEQEQHPGASLTRAGGGVLPPTWAPHPRPRRLMAPALPSLTHKIRHRDPCASPLPQGPRPEGPVSTPPQTSSQCLGNHEVAARTS